MSATTIIDLGGIACTVPSFGPAAGVGSTPASGVVIGMVADLRDYHMLTNVCAFFGPSTSGQFRLQVQTSDSTASGTFTDPTSGMAQFPTNLVSGGILIVNSGNINASGGVFFGGFQRLGRYARINCMSGDQFNAPVGASFVCQPHRTGSGPGYSMSPGSGISGFQGVGGF